MVVSLIFHSCHQTAGKEKNREKTEEYIGIYSENPFYWQYKGKPVLLIGGSKEDNLFNHPENLGKHLDELKASGGNYIRNTMSSRNPGNPWAFKKGEDGLYDLNEWDKEYWNRFENLLKLCHERDIIVQIEIWDPWDYFKSEASLGYGPDNVGWESCPFNPALNKNYTPEESRLATEIDYFSSAIPTDHLFFATVPELEDIPVVRQYQEAFVEKILSYTFSFPNVLYCMNNEIGEAPEWGEYWARFIREKADQVGKEVNMTDMRRNTDFSSEEQINLLNNEDLFDFFEISQNNANNDQDHYDQIQRIRDQVLEAPRPLNNVKIYGGQIGQWTTSVEEGTRRFWRNIFGGCASARFHRPGPSYQFFGLGLSELAQIHLKSMRMMVDELDIFQTGPSNNLLKERDSNEAYCLAEKGEAYAVYFPDGGSVILNLSERMGEVSVRWLNVLENKWLDTEKFSVDNEIELTTPGQRHWVVLVEKI